MPKKSACGFTLIELLISISIIAVLSAIGMVTYSVVLKQGRDSKRQSDLRSVQSVLEQYYADKFSYPRVGSSCSSGTLTFGCVLKDPTGSKTYINTVPNDSNIATPYAYIPFKSDGTLCNVVGNICTTYCLYARLENPPSPTPTLPTGCSSDPRYNFVLGPP